MFGCKREDIIGASLDRFSPPLQPDGRDSRKKAGEKIQAAYGGSPQFFEWIHCKADGTLFIAEVSLSLIELTGGIFLLAVVRDISDRRQLEEQLLQAQKMEAIGILAGGVAHDFNNILSTVVGYSSLLNMKLKKDDPLKEYIERILVATERAVHLTSSLLAFSRKQDIELQPVEINGAISGFHKILARLIGEDIDFGLDLVEQSLVVDVDVRQFEQVLMNLATNSRDAMPNGGKLTISTSCLILDEVAGEIPNGAYALISIADTGCGMDAKVHAHLFEPFFTTKEVGKGTGLGLAIVYGIIKKHNGFIRAESAAGQGTTFHVYLPLKSLRREKRVRKKSEKMISGTETILLIEDDATVRQVIRSILDEFGYKVIEAADGVEAVAIFAHEQGKVQLILCDLIMPKKNGRETIAEIRQIRPDVKVIFISGYAADIIAHKGRMDPDIPMLLKPLKPTELLAKVRQLLDS
jgi:PAS domain S-box-containing protein